MEDSGTVLIVTHVAIRQGARGTQIDDQTAAGIAQWCRYFDKVTYYGVAEDHDAGVSSAAWVDTTDGLIGARSKVLAFPRGYRLGSMAKAFRGVRTTLRDEIDRHSHLCYTIGGLIGDWPALAALESIRKKRRFAAWIDRVEPSIIRNKLIGASIQRRLAATVAVPIMEKYTQHVLRHSAVALLQGLDTFNHYARWAPDPQVTYDTHTHVSDQITPIALARKQARILRSAPLNIVYVGRVAAMKGPTDWLDTLEHLRLAHVPFHATWVGNGPELSAMKARVAGSELAGAVDFLGFEENRDVLLGKLLESDLLLFCHKTPESPRCLIESLVCGCPIVGYESAYPRGLTQERGGASFAPLNDVNALAGKIIALHLDRLALSKLIAAAAASGELYNEDAVYARRAGLMMRA